MNPRLSVSVMCANLMNMERDIRTLEECGADCLHVDIMDAAFVPNLTFGPDFVSAMRSVTGLPLDIHLLMQHPGVIVRSLDIRTGDIVSIHRECGDDIAELADFVRGKGARFGLALNPGTPVEAVREYLPAVDVILLMLIAPGFAGRSMVEGIMEKVAVARRYLNARGFTDVEISVDGSVSRERAAYMRGLGASIFVGGTAGIFRKGMPLHETVSAFKESITGGRQRKGGEE